MTRIKTPVRQTGNNVQFTRTFEASAATGDNVSFNDDIELDDHPDMPTVDATVENGTVDVSWDLQSDNYNSEFKADISENIEDFPLSSSFKVLDAASSIEHELYYEGTNRYAVNAYLEENIQGETVRYRSQYNILEIDISMGDILHAVYKDIEGNIVQDLRSRGSDSIV